MTTEYDRDELHDSAEEDSVVTTGPAADGDEGSGEDPDNAEVLSDSAEDEDDGQVVIARSDGVPSPVTGTGQAANAYDGEVHDEDDEDDEEPDDEAGEALAAPGLGVAEPDSLYNDSAAAAASEADRAAPDTAAPAEAPVGSHARVPSEAEPGVDTLLTSDAAEVQRRWSAIQSSFVDDPRGSVTDAAKFLEETTTALMASIEQRRRDLRSEWDRDGLDTEDLRNALRRYRGMLERIAAL